MKCLPPKLFLTNDENDKCWAEKLKMCTQPSKKQGVMMILTRDIRNLKAGTVGVARLFNDVDYERQYLDERKYILYGLKGKLIFELSKRSCYDFYPLYEGGVSFYHFHLNMFDCEPYEVKKNKKVNYIKNELVQTTLF